MKCILHGMQNTFHNEFFPLGKTRGRILNLSFLREKSAGNFSLFYTFGKNSRRYFTFLHTVIEALEMTL